MLQRFQAFVAESDISAAALWALCGLCVVYAVEQYDRYLLSVAHIPFIDYTSYEYSLLSGPLFSVVFTLSGVVLSLYSDVKSNRVLVIAVSCVAWSASLALTALCTEFWQLALLRILMGIAQSTVMPYASSLISEYFSEKTRGVAFGVFNFAIYVGYSASLSLGTYMYDEYGWKSGYVVFGLVGLGASVFLLLTTREKAATPKPATPQVETESHTAGLLASREHSLKSLDPPAGSESPSFAKRWRDFKAVLTYWKDHPALLAVCLVTSVRFAAAYIWSYYTSVFFSELWVTDETSCTFSYSSDYSGKQDCSADYPFCRTSTGECSDISPSPWHNEGMTHEDMATYISWIPLVGSGVGGIMGGYLSDLAFAMFSRMGEGGTHARMYVAAVSNLAATPFVILSLFLKFPWCFLVFLPSGWVGEMYIGLSLAAVADMVPQSMTTTSIALYMCVITFIGGSATLLVPLLKGWYDEDHTFTFHAAPRAGSEEAEDSSSTTFHVHRSGGRGLQYSLLTLFTTFYVLSALLYLAVVPMVRRDASRRASSLGYQRAPSGAADQEQPAKEINSLES